MATQTSRRDELAEAAADHVLEHGLVGLRLRPLAAALGTSDRMLLYHFADRDDLVASLLRVVLERSTATVAALPPAGDVRAAVRGLWEASLAADMLRCQRVYVEATVLGLGVDEPSASVVAETNAAWVRALAAYLRAAGGRPDRVERAARLLDVGVGGLLLDQPLRTTADDGRSSDTQQTIGDLADAVAALCG